MYRCVFSWLLVVVGIGFFLVVFLILGWRQVIEGRVICGSFREKRIRVFCFFLCCLGFRVFQGGCRSFGFLFIVSWVFKFLGVIGGFVFFGFFSFVVVQVLLFFEFSSFFFKLGKGLQGFRSQRCCCFKIWVQYQVQSYEVFIGVRIIFWF